MLLQTNSYVVPKERRSEHARILRRFKQALARLGCDQFEVYEQAGSNWSSDEASGRFVQIMRFRDRRHQLAVQAAERQDSMAQAIIAEFCELINFPYQHQQGLFAIGYYTSILNSRETGEQAQMTSDASAARARVSPPHPQSVALDSVLGNADASHEPPTAHAPEIIEQATALMSVPFADVPMHEPVGSADEPITTEVTPVNGSALSHDAPLDPQSMDPHTSARELDQLIRRHFGDDAASESSDVVEFPAELNGHASTEADGSGIGDLLNSVQHGIDLNDAFPADLMDPDDMLDANDASGAPGNPQHSDASHAHTSPIEEFHRDENAR